MCICESLFALERVGAHLRMLIQGFTEVAPAGGQKYPVMVI